MSVIAGIEKFKEAMRGHEEEYVLIGGGACSILFNDAGADFRLTKDLDVVVLVDNADSSFGRSVWNFVMEGGYKPGKRSDGGCAYYRFTLPKDSPNAGVYPREIELFAHHPDFTLESEGAHVTPLPFDSTIASLSAIILEEGYYEFIKENAVQIDGVSLLSALHIIPLKMRAHIDNIRLNEEGVEISEKNFRKHRADVANLADLHASDDRLLLVDQMRSDAEVFFDDFEAYIVRETNRKRKAALEMKLSFLRSVYT